MQGNEEWNKLRDGGPDPDEDHEAARQPGMRIRFWQKKLDPGLCTSNKGIK